MTEQNGNERSAETLRMQTAEQMPLSAAVKKIAWGYVFLHLHFNLETLDILPDWACYTKIDKAMDSIGGWVPSIKLLRPLGRLLCAYTVIQWLWKAFAGGVELAGSLVYLVPAVTLLATVISLYFHFQLLTDLAGLADQLGLPQKQRLLTLRTVRTVLMTVFALPFPWAEYEVLAYVVLVLQLVITFWICSVLFSLKNSLLELEQHPEGQEAAEEEESPCNSEEDFVE